MERKESVGELLDRLLTRPAHQPAHPLVRPDDEGLPQILHKYVERARPPVDLKLHPCTWTKEDGEVTERILRTWLTGAEASMSLAASMMKAGKGRLPPEQWKKSLDALNQMLDAIQPLEGVVRAIVRYCAKHAALTAGFIRLRDLADDINFAEQVRTELDLDPGE